MREPLPNSDIVAQEKPQCADWNPQAIPVLSGIPRDLSLRALRNDNLLPAECTVTRRPVFHEQVK